jgi:hypothetical protein
MSSTSFASTVTVALAFLATACGSTPPAETHATSGQAQTVDPAFTICAFDSDCVAVPQAGCCSNGWLAAVNADLLSSYECANACTQQTVCPMYVVNDTRVAVCDNDALACTLVAPASIACGGGGVNPHSCPTGYTCVGGDDTTTGTCSNALTSAPSEDAGTPSDDAGSAAPTGN